MIDEFIDLIEDEDFIVISDYHKGTIEHKDIVRIIDRCKELEDVTIFVDTNYVYPEHENVDWLKINLKTAKKCVKRYLTSHAIGGFFKIGSNDWPYAVGLPIQSWKVNDKAMNFYLLV